MNKRNRLKTIRPQNERAARAFRKKQNMKVELNKKWLPVVYVVMLGICILLNVTNDSLDPANVLISVCICTSIEDRIDPVIIVSRHFLIPL